LCLKLCQFWWPTRPIDIEMLPLSGAQLVSSEKDVSKSRRVESHKRQNDVEWRSSQLQRCHVEHRNHILYNNNNIAVIIM